MRINTNVASLNAQRMLAKTDADAARIMGRLSSGFRINHASDDAAGMAIANKLRADLRGLKQASRNAEQANALLQVAEGAAQTIQSIVERMKELSIQATSDNVDDAARAKLDQEFTALKDEITRIVNTTKFNGNKLIDGSFGNKLDTSTGKSTLIGTAGVSASSITLSGAKQDSFTLTAAADGVTLEDSSGNQQKIAGTVDGSQGEQTWNFTQFGITVKTTNLGATDSGTIDVATGTVSFTVSVSGGQGSGGGAGADDVAITGIDLSLAGLGISGSIDTKSNAQAAVGQIDAAISNIASALGTIGAAQNRIQFASDNVRTTIENVSAAESTIRDADMAEEMSNFTKTQILQQAGTAMLAQANAAPQLVLKLLG